MYFMQIREEYKIFKDTNTPLDYEIDVLHSDMLKMQIVGEGNCEIEVLAKLTKSKDYSPIAIINDNTYDMMKSITTTGLYTVSTTGYKKVKISVKQVVNTLQCTAVEVDE